MMAGKTKSAPSKALPTWHKEAILDGINYIVLIYEKAEGFAFCPISLEFPFRVGGDYGGNLPVSASGALEHYHRYLNEHFKDRIKWFFPYLEMVHNKKDFSLQALDISGRGLNVIRGEWPW
ncbi:hypothetical protein [Planctobacterium marinum]|uniref:hypothetical protein n=1 Tax=Planctobacterium marinum TaxID=1631968 RepID=UPI001E40BB56|nr:hypothetical protein [Planctobacterium marinum]MCC2607423.1 hypothetical protein [Planctobacterium marinum]